MEHSEQSDCHLSTFDEINERLGEIASIVNDSDVNLDEALDLFDEAIDLGMRATQVLEADIAPSEE